MFVQKYYIICGLLAGDVVFAANVEFIPVSVLLSCNEEIVSSDGWSNIMSNLMMQ